MRLESMLLMTMACRQVAAHSLFTTLFVNDQDQGDGTCIRMPKNPANATFPVVDLQGKEMICGFDGEQSVARICPVPQSAKLSFLFRTWPDGTQPDKGAIDISHKGPCAVYMKAQGHASDWFKIYDEGYDEKTFEWCSEKIIKNNGFLSVKIPADLVGGSYLVRTELLALHEADKSPPNPQFYIGCAQIFLKSTATALPSETVKIPGYVNIQDPSVLYNIWETDLPPYMLPGPKRYISGSLLSTKVHPSLSQTEGLLPAEAILTNANWWGVEVPSWNDEPTCRKSAQSCWDQSEKCYSSAPPTGSSGCRLWEEKCNAINENCNSASPSGPQNPGQMIEVEHAVYSIPPVREFDADVIITSQPTAPAPAPTTLIHLVSIPKASAAETTASVIVGSEPPKTVLQTTAVTLPPPQATFQAETSTKSATEVSSSNLPPSSTTSSPTPSTPPSASSTPTPTSVSSSSPTSASSITPKTATTSSNLPTSTFPPSSNDRCGITGGHTSCAGNPRGRCCAGGRDNPLADYCGNTISHCSVCQQEFGECGPKVAMEEENKRLQAGRKRMETLNRRSRGWKRGNGSGWSV